MTVIYREPLGDGHSIEVGFSTWDPNAISVRDRYDNSNGHFSPHSSSEFPLGDLSEIIRVVLAGLPEVFRQMNAVQAGETQ
jgi:hypothetical protein